MVDVRVHSAVRDEPEQMDVSPAFARAPERGDERRVLGERAIGDREVHAGEVLKENSPRADREVTDLRISHLPGWQPHGLTRRGESRVREAFPEGVEHRRSRELDRIPRPGRCDTPPVENDEDDRSHRAPAPARQISSNDWTSSEAPPTSAPSTSGKASRRPAFSGFTEPP